MIALLIFLLLSAVDVPALAARPESRSEKISREIKREREELDRLRKEVAEQKARAKRARKKEESLLDEIEEMDQRIRLKGKELALVERQLSNRGRNVSRVQEERAALAAELEQRREIVKAYLRGLYKEGRAAALGAVVDAEDYRDALRRSYLLRAAAKREEETLKRFEQQARALDEKDRQLSLVRQDLLADRSEVARALEALRLERKGKDRLLVKISQQRELYERSSLEMLEASRAVEAILRRLEQERKEALNPPRGNFAAEKGRLPWPSAGNVVSFFGRQKHPRFDAVIFKKGIEIAAQPGETARAIHPGRVVFADWLKGYGMVVILDHGDNYYSLYAHLAKALVAPGRMVPRLGVVGEVGDTGFASSGSALYLEVRHRQEAMNPLSWLSRRR